MKTKLFADKKIVVRELEKSDIKNAGKFRFYINSLIEEDAKLSMNRPATLKEEVEFIKSVLKGIKDKTAVYLVAECNDKIIGTTRIESEKWRKKHIGRFSIAIIDGYRGVGLGKYLISEIIKLAKNNLDSKPTIIQLEVYANNKLAIGLYKKMGFKTVAKLPRQIQYKGKLVGEQIIMKNI